MHSSISKRFTATVWTVSCVCAEADLSCVHNFGNVFPSSHADSGRSDIIIKGESCRQRNANIDLAAQLLSKPLSALSHEARWCLHGNFMRTLKPDIGPWNVIFTGVLHHSRPHRWWAFDSGKRMDRIQKTSTNCVCSLRVEGFVHNLFSTPFQCSVTGPQNVKLWHLPVVYSVIFQFQELNVDEVNQLTVG